MARCHPRESSYDLGVFSQGLGWFLGPAWGAGCAPLVLQHGKSHVACGLLTSSCTSLSQKQVSNISEPYILELFHVYNNHRWAGPWPELSLTCWNEIAV